MQILIGEKMMDVSKFEMRKLECGETVWVKPPRRKNDTETLFNEIGKVCKDCGKFVEWVGYNKNKVCVGGRLVNCVVCRSNINKQRYNDNTNSIKKQNKRYRTSNADSVSKRNKRYHVLNKDYISERNKQHRNNKAKYNANKLPIGYVCTSDENGLLLISCYKCGKLHHTTNHSLSMNIQAQSGIRNTSCNIYCSTHCKETCNVYGVNQHRLAKRHLLNLPMAPQRTSNRPYVSQKFISQVLNTDEHTCQKCGNKHLKLHVHHVIGATRHPEFANDLDNCITLCESCHDEIHHQEGCSFYDYRLDENK